VSTCSPTFRDALLHGAQALGLSLTEAEVEAYGRHYALLLEHNARAGLTTITDPAEAAVKHYLDSLSCLLARDIGPGEEVADVGSGAGFPGLVLAIARPQARCALLESSTKRVAFLRLAVSALALDNVEVVPLRAEEAGRRPEHRERCHLVLARAVARLPVLLEYTLPLARVDGYALLMKGPEAEEEAQASTRALDLLGGRLVDITRLDLPFDMGRRSLVLVKKISPTPPRYPRRPGLPAKRPL
jgi:16S rRNA (guanine527-N7)-methyltransferase